MFQALRYQKGPRESACEVKRHGFGSMGCYRVFKISSQARSKPPGWVIQPTRLRKRMRLGGRVLTPTNNRISLFGYEVSQSGDDPRNPHPVARKQRERHGKNILLWLVIAVVLLTVFQNFNVSRPPEEVPYSTFLELVNGNQVRSVEVDGLIIRGERSDGISLKPFSLKLSTRP